MSTVVVLLLLVMCPLARRRRGTAPAGAGMEGSRLLMFFVWCVCACTKKVMTKPPTPR